MASEPIPEALISLAQLALAPSSSSKVLEVEIIALKGPRAWTERLMEFGLCPGERVELLGATPFAGPLVFRTSTTTLALRKDEAACVQVRPV